VVCASPPPTGSTAGSSVWICTPAACLKAPRSQPMVLEPLRADGIPVRW
jgi:hypothetical protein